MLQDKHIKLRAIEPEDIDLLYIWENNTDLWEISNISVPTSKHHLVQFVQEASLGIYETKQLRLMIEIIEPKQTIGCIDLFDFDAFHERAGVGILISDTGDRNKGYATRALKLLIEYAKKHLSLHQLYCNILEDNTISVKLFEKCGFKINGKKTDWVKSRNKHKDEYFLQLILS